MINEFAPLPRSFYLPSAKVVARKLLGRVLVRQTPLGLCGGPIVETEAYLQNDPACHAWPGLTPRNRVMFGPPGHAYVYFIYGCHFCVNAVCQPERIGEAVLIRAIEAEFGQDLMRRNRPCHGLHNLTNGPAKLCEALDITRNLDGVDLCDGASPLFIAENRSLAGFRRQRRPFLVTPRIGITQAAEMPLRFCLAGSKYASRRERFRSGKI